MDDAVAAYCNDNGWIHHVSSQGKGFCFMTNRAEPFEGVDESRKNYGAFMTLSSTLTYRRLTKTEQKAYDRLKEWFEQLTGRKDARTRQLLLAAKAFATVKFF